MQNLLLLVILLLALGLTYTVRKWRGGMHMTFSQHAAFNRYSKMFYAALFLITLPLLICFFTDWLVPEKDLPDSFLWFATIAVIFQIACTFVPETGGSKTLVHRALSAISGVALLPLVFIIATSDNLPLFTRISAYTSLIVMVTILIIVLRNRRWHSKALLLQIGYYTAFFYTLFIATYL